MSTALMLVPGSLSLLLVVVVAVLLMPVNLRARIRTAPELTCRVDASALGGIVPRILVVDSARRR